MFSNNAFDETAPRQLQCSEVSAGGDRHIKMEAIREIYNSRDR